MEREYKNEWGIRCFEDMRCSEDRIRTLWCGKQGSVEFKLIFPEITEKVKDTLRKIRGDRGGVFWINPTFNMLTIATDDSVDSGDYPQTSYEENVTKIVCDFCGKLIGGETHYDYLGDIELKFCNKECKKGWNWENSSDYQRMFEPETNDEFNKKLNRLSKLGITLSQQTSHSFAIVEENPDDLILYQDESPILKISLPEQSTQWNTKLP